MMKVFKFIKKQNRIIEPFAHPLDLTVTDILPHKLCEKDTVIGGDSAAGSAGDSKETE